MKKLFMVATFFIFVASLFVMGFSQAQASGVVTPTLLAPAEGDSYDLRQPAIRGVTKNNTRVAIYIDDVFNGYATVSNGTEGTASFVYFPYVDLTSGYHSVKVRAENEETGARSDVSPLTGFYVEQPYPAPQIHYAVVNDDTTWKKPFISGVAKNDSTVKIYIDGAYNGEFKVMNSGTGTASFAYRPFFALSSGTHDVYAVAVSPDGKTSATSTSLSFAVEAPKVETTATTPATTEETVAAEEKVVEEVAKEPESSDEGTEAASEETEAVEEATEEDASEEEAKEESEVDASEAEEEEEIAEGEEEENKSSTIGWVLLILIAAALVWRNRKSFSSMMKNDKGDDFVKKVDEENSSSVEVVEGEKESKNEDESSNKDNN